MLAITPATYVGNVVETLRVTNDYIEAEWPRIIVVS